MTLLVATITSSGAVVSQDSWIYKQTDAARTHAAKVVGITEDAAEAAESTYVGDGTEQRVELIGQGLKIFAVPRFEMVVAGSGGFAVLLHWFLELMAAQAPTLEALHVAAPERLRQVRDTAAPGEAAVILHAGFDRRRGCGFGRVFSSDDGFAGSEVKIGHIIGPAPDQEDADYPRIAKLWESASKGWQVEELHRALFDQQVRAMAAGKLAPGVAVGGDLHHVEVSAGGIAITMAPSRAWKPQAA